MSAEVVTSDAVISVRGVRLSFPQARLRVSGVKEALLRPFSKRPRMPARGFEALRGVDLEVRRGEVLGLIGRNGSGKSTLLRVICGIYEPDRGEVRVEGRISPLLELGAGFREELSGIENIRLSGAIMGFSPKQVDELVDPIVEFADLGAFIHQPIRTYSSGMKARLGFAVASAVDPEILLIDEALAVGDAKFRDKCTERIDEMVAGDTTVVLVSHSKRDLEQLCTRLALLHRGRISTEGPPDEVLARYAAM
jgi:ABC-type polysaccharide/polyol phosphate transport system ATPase subunit